MKPVQIDDDLTDLSWLIQLNNSQQKHLLSTFQETTKKSERIVKPLAVVNGQKTKSRSSLATLSPEQYSNEENQFYSHSTTSKRKCHPSPPNFSTNKRFHNEQTLPVYPNPSDFVLYETSPSASTTQPQQRTTIPSNSSQSRYMLWKTDPSLSDTLSTVPTTKSFEDENLYSEDIDHLLDIFKNEIELIGLDPMNNANGNESPLDLVQCFSSNEFCSY